MSQRVEKGREGKGKKGEGEGEGRKGIIRMMNWKKGGDQGSLNVFPLVFQ